MHSSRPGALLKTPPPRQVTPPPRPTSRIKVLVAGVDKDARAAVESSVRQAFSGRDPSEEWSVSLVRLGSSWSVTLNGPGDRFKSLSFSVEQHRLAEAIREKVSQDAAPAAGAAPAAPAPAALARTAAAPTAARGGRGRIEDRHSCASCKQALVVSYEGDPGEPKQRVPVACPHCWIMNHVEIGSWAASGGDYSAAKA